jgi:hypothetical protein
MGGIARLRSRLRRAPVGRGRARQGRHLHQGSFAGVPGDPRRDGGESGAGGVFREWRLGACGFEKIERT